MSRQQIIYRLIATDSQLNANKIKSNKMTENEWQTLSQSMNTISKLPIFIDDSPNLTVTDIRAKLQKLFFGKNNNGLVIIDYTINVVIQKMITVHEISLITRQLKILAKEFNIPIIVLSQLSRNVESRVNKRPLLSDLRESGCINNIKLNQLTPTLNFQTGMKIDKNVWHFKGIKPTFNITLNNNYKLSLTANRKILIKEGFV